MNMPHHHQPLFELMKQSQYKPTFIFQIHHHHHHHQHQHHHSSSLDSSKDESVFDQLKKQYGIRFGFHGSHVENWWSILHHGKKK